MNELMNQLSIIKSIYFLFRTILVLVRVRVYYYQLLYAVVDATVFVSEQHAK